MMALLGEEGNQAAGNRRSKLKGFVRALFCISLSSALCLAMSPCCTYERESGARPYEWGRCKRDVNSHSKFTFYLQIKRVTNSCRVDNTNILFWFSVMGKCFLFLTLCSTQVFLTLCSTLWSKFMFNPVLGFCTESRHMCSKAYMLHLQLVSWEPAGDTHELSAIILIFAV